jgi:hypothetical protein
VSSLITTVQLHYLSGQKKNEVTKTGLYMVQESGENTKGAYLVCMLLWCACCAH